MSKSLGNTIEPQDVIKQSGADILRLWVAMSDYREEIRVSKEILARVVEAYRKIRNTLRYLLANLYDFDPATDRVPIGAARGGRSLHPRALRRRRPSACCDAYEAYDYRTIFQALNAFTTVDLSAFYADVSKDRLYTFARALARAAVGADGDVHDGRRAHAAAGADPVVHGRRAVALPARHARGVGAPRALPAEAELDGAARPGAASSAGSG